MKKVFYPLSLLVLAVSVFLILNYPDSGRMNMISGGLLAIGFILNILGYYLTRETLTGI